MNELKKNFRALCKHKSAKSPDGRGGGYAAGCANGLRDSTFHSLFIYALVVAIKRASMPVPLLCIFQLAELNQRKNSQRAASLSSAADILWRNSDSISIKLIPARRTIERAGLDTGYLRFLCRLRPSSFTSGNYSAGSRRLEAKAISLFSSAPNPDQRKEGKPNIR